MTPSARGSRNTRARARIARAGSCGTRRQFRGEVSGNSNRTDGRAEDLPLGGSMRRLRKTMPAISSKPAWARRVMRLCPNRRYPLGRDCVAAIAGFLRIPGGFSRATHAVGPDRRNPVPLERAARGTTQSKRTILSIGALPPLQGYSYVPGTIRPGFSCSWTTGETQNRFRPDLLTKYKRFDATLAKVPDLPR